MKNNFCLVLILVGLFAIGFVGATAASAPTSLLINQNVTALYDEGTFFVNWTNASVDTSYRIYIWAGGDLFNVTAVNNSGGDVTSGVAGLTYVNFTEANYTFTIEASNGTTGFGANSSNISMYVDATAPLVNWTNSGYTNSTYKKNTDKLTLNISVGDALSGLTNGYCVFDINGTNETIAISNGWCNSTQFNLTGLADGNATIDIWANDTVGNVGVNLSTYIVWVDTTAPTMTYTCSPTSVYVSDTISCSCTGADASSGVSTTSYTASPSTTASGTFNVPCTVTDLAGNSLSTSISYIVGIMRSTGGEGGSSSISSWANTYIITNEQFNEGISKELSVKERMKFKVDNIEHYLSILELADDSVKIEVASTPQETTLVVGEEKKFDIDEDGYYDLVATLNSISNGKADITIKEISEEIIEEDKELSSSSSSSSTQETSSEQESKSISYWKGVVVILVLIVVVFFYTSKSKKKVDL